MANEFKIRKGLIVEGATSGTVVDVQGSLGQLFSVTDNLTGEIFAVADISGVPIMTVNSSGVSYFDGKVGIGTTSPDAKLTISKTSFSTTFTSADSYIRIGKGENGQNGYQFIGFGYNNGAADQVPAYIGFQQTGTPGNYTKGALVFGTRNVTTNTAPTERMRIDGAGALKLNAYDGTNNTGSPTYILGTDSSGNVVKVLGGDIPGGGGTVTGNGANGEIAFWTSSSVLDGDSLFKWNASNNRLGVGVATPLDRLHVNVGTDQNIAFNSINSLARISSYNDAQTLSKPLQINGSDLRFLTGSSEKMRITPSGQIGIGGIPQTTLASEITVEIGASGIIYSERDASQYNSVSIGSNWYYDSTNSRVEYKNAVVPGATNYLQYQGEHIFRTAVAPSAANDPITWNDRMVIENGGDVGIGITGPGARLDVFGPDLSTGTIKWQNAGSRRAGYLYSDSGGIAIFDTNLSEAGIYMMSNTRIDFRVNGSERMRITSAGGISFGSTGTAYGTSGQVLTSAGNASPTWQNNGSGDISGSGTAGYVTKFTGTKTIGNGPMVFNSNNFELLQTGVFNNSVHSLYNGTSSGGTGTTVVQYIKIFDKVGNANQQYLHFELVSFNGSEYSAEVKVIVPAYSGFSSSYGTMDDGMGVQVEITYGGLSVQTSSILSIIEVADLSSTSSGTELYLKIQPAAASTAINVRDYGDCTQRVLINQTWSTTAPSYQHREFTFNVAATNINQVLSIHRDQKIGIGTTSPGAKLEVAGGNGAVGGTGLVYFNNSDDAASLVINNAGTSSQNDRGVFDARIGGSSVFKINNSGNVGIGTTSPGTKLAFGGFGSIWVNNDSTNPFGMDTVGGELRLFVGTGADSYQMKFGKYSGTTFTPHMTIGDDASRPSFVGIGTTSPNAKLTLFNPTEDVSINVNTGTGGSYPKKTGISFGATSTSLGGDAEFTGGAGIQAVNTAASGNPTNLTFWTNSAGTPAERMQITTVGELQVTGNGVIRNEHSSANYSYWQQTASDARLFTQYAQPLYFGTNASTKMTILSGGNVGIGTTGPDGTLEIVQPSGNGSAGIPTLMVTNDANGASGYTWQSWRYVESNTSFRLDLKQRVTGGVVQYSFNMVNNGVGFDDVLVLDRGKVGIGTTFPDAELEVRGTTVISTVSDGVNSVLIGLAGSNRTTVQFDTADTTHTNRQWGLTNIAGDFYVGRHGLNVMTMKNNGNVGIGTTTPLAKLDIQGTQGQLFSVTDDLSGEIFAVADISGVPIMSINSNGISTFAGDIKLGPSSSIVTDDQPAASTASGSGTIVNWSVSATVTAGLMYILKFDGTWTATDADSEVKSTGMVTIALGTNATQGMLLQGFFYKSAHGFTIGLPLYISNTTGALTNTRPNGTNDYVRIVGYATSTNYIYFDPDKTWVQVA